ncbi:MiaB/RimO family radical SAM methylthiotransferase [candidate division WOR-3 bacterium]|nr:MiaB/RimO family radical SAM methylthiotransferase [candidate division WOR-3 bacterium]
MKKFFIDFNGCHRNHVDAELVSSRLIENSYLETNSPESADICIFLGCGFVEEARRESIEMIIETRLSMKKEAVLVVGGCIFRRHGAELKKNLPEVDIWVEGSNPESFVKALKTGESSRDLLLPSLEGNRNRMGLFHIGFVKISEGCLNNCSFCAIPYIRGLLRSRPMENIIAEVEKFQDEGCTELILVSQDATAYGKDLNRGESLLTDLIRKLENTVNKETRYRIPYLHPKGLDDNLIDTIGNSEKMVKCLDIPVQHFSDKILKSMNRGYSGEKILDLVCKIRKKINEVALRTTFMVGFPGEDEDDVELLLDCAPKIKFERAGIFVFSPEEKTPAINFESQISKSVSRKRYFKVKKVLEDIMLEQDKKRQGEVVEGIIDGYLGDYAVARTDWDMPDIDKAIFIKDGERKLFSGTWSNFKITRVTKNRIYAENTE